MKIQLSKTQWEQIGLKAGWVVSSQTNPGNDAKKQCSECKGNKTIHEKLRNPGSGELVDHISICPTCSGKGYTDQKDNEHWLHSMGVAVPVDKIIGTTVSGMNEQQIDEDMHFKGYFLFREHYPWGKTLSYRNEKGDTVFLNVDFQGVDAEDLNARGVATWVSWDQLKEILKRDWRPAGKEDQDWMIANLGS